MARLRRRRVFSKKAALTGTGAARAGAPFAINDAAKQVMDDLKADSLSVVELVLAIEEAFGLEIPDEDAEKIKTVGDVVNYVKARAK